MKKVHVALGIPSEYREWRWLLSSLRREKCGLPLREKIKRIKVDALARPITVVELAINEGRKKRLSPPAQEMFAEKKLKTSSAAREGSLAAQETPAENKSKTSSAAREGSPAAPKLVIDLTSSKGEKKEAARFVLVAPAIPKATSLIADRIALRRNSFVPSVPKFVPKRSSGAKSGSSLERLATMKSDKVPLPAKVVPKPDPSAAETDSSAEKKKIAHAGSHEKSTMSVSGELAEICAFLKPYLLEDMDVYAKFVDGVKWVVGPSSFMKHMTEYKRTTLLAMMQKTTIQAADAS